MKRNKIIQTLGHEKILNLLNEASDSKFVGIDDPEDLDLALPMYNLLEYISNYSNTTGSLWFYSKNETANLNNATSTDDDNFKCFKYKTQLIGNKTAANGILDNATISVSLKHLSNFWR